MTLPLMFSRILDRTGTLPVILFAMPRTFTITFLLLVLSTLLSAQDAAGRYGDEWITPGTTYLRIEVAEDGMYRVSPAMVTAAGLPAGETEAQRYRLYHQGRAVPLDLSTGQIVFYGERATSALDSLLFENGEEDLLNPRYGLYTDTAAYYLTTTAEDVTAERYTAGTGGGGAQVQTVYRKAEQLFTGGWSKYFRRSSGSTIQFSHYELAEGFGQRNNNDLLSSNGSRVSTAKVALPGGSSGSAELTVRFGLAFGDGHRQQVRVNGSDKEQFTSEGWSVNERTYAYSNTGTSVELRMEGLVGAQDKANLASVTVRYPAAATPTGSQFAFELPAGADATLPAPAGTQARLYDLTNRRVYTPAGGGFPVPGTGTVRQLMTVTEYREPAATTVVTLEELLPPAQTDYLIISSRRLDGAGLQALVEYRTSPAGGSYRVHRVFVEDLYDSYGYGLRRHPQAMRNYIAAARQRAPGLNYLFLVGKGREYTDLRSAGELAAAWRTFFVPSFGLPASDNLLSAPNGSLLPTLATGRLSAISPEEVALYARKLADVEGQIAKASQTIDDLEWMKEALFLGGGGSPGERAAIAYNLSSMERIFESSVYGGNVTTVQRTSSEPIEDARTETIFDRINAGTPIITFHGHSSSQGFDYNIDNPENYDNTGRYPLIISLGCYSGDAFTAARSISERFIFMPDGGAVTFAASKGLGYISALGTFGRAMMNHLGNDHYGDGIGSSMRAAVGDYAGTNNFTLGILLEQFSLSGDPAFRFHPRPGPDLVIDPASVTFEPGVLPAQDTSFTVSLRLANIGSHPVDIPDSTQLLFRQQLPSGEIRELARRKVAVPYFDNPLTITLPFVGFEAIGANRLLITVDPENNIDELPVAAAEQNNELQIGGTPGAPFTIIANSAKAAYPPPYAVVGPGVQLVAGSSDPLAPERKYRIQVALTPAFQDLLADEEISAVGGVIRHTPSLTWRDSTTYFWRISPDSTSTGVQGYLWDQSSFTYVADRPANDIGYAMQHAGQFREGDIQSIVVPEDDAANWGYTRTVNDVELFNGVFRSQELPKLVWNGQRFASTHPWHLHVGVQVMLIDSTNNSTWYRGAGDGSYNSVPKRGTPWSFNTRTAQGRQGLMRFLDEYVQDGWYVIFWSVQRGNDLEYHNDGWLADSTDVGRTLYGVLEAEGAEQVRLLESLGSVPYTFAYQKGHGAIAEAIASDQLAQTQVLIPLYQNFDEGTYTTPEIGPALAWRAMHMDFREANVSASDSTQFRLYGLRTDGGRELLLEQGAKTAASALRLDLSNIDAAMYPHLQASVELYDRSDRSAATIKNIYFDYQRPGDAAVNPTVAYTAPEQLIQGELATFEVGYENLMPVDMDSLLAELTVYDEQNQATILTKRQPPLPANGTDRVSFELPTQDINSSLRVQLRLNPNGDQPEEITFNNLLNTEVGLETDNIDPDLKVYYDGRTIRDGELISAKPEILIQLHDENEFRRLDDSSAYAITLLHPDQTSEIIRLSDDRVDFVPAPADGDNTAEVYFRPELQLDGMYKLTVQATDRSRNRPGRLDYEQQFEVVNQQLITNVLTYPNPFTSQTRFVYTLTGSVPPDVFRIQIMTVSGRVVRDIDLLAYENISVGTHQTDFAWDGTDEYGDLLANGVYLYRVITSDADGQELEAYDNGTDQYFRNGLGKVVILR